VASQVDAVLPAGGVGVFVGGDGNDVVLDRLSVRVPSQAGTTVRASSPTPMPTAIPFRPVTRVVIPRIALDAPSVPAGLSHHDGAITWDVPPFKIGHAQETAGAGAPGNAVLVGHVTSRTLGNVFERLHEVTTGDAVQVFSTDQVFSYRVVEARTG